MMKKTYARVESGLVVELIETDGDISKMFHPDLTWVECENQNVAIGWNCAGGSFAAPVSENVDQRRVAKWSAIKAERDRRSEQGGYKVGTKWFHSDQKSRSQQLGLVLLGASIPAGLQWKTMDGSFVTMTQTLAQQILAAGAASDQAIFAAAETHKAAMEASADPSAYDFSGGWPATFAG